MTLKQILKAILIFICFSAIIVGIITVRKYHNQHKQQKFLQIQEMRTSAYQLYKYGKMNEYNDIIIKLSKLENSTVQDIKTSIENLYKMNKEDTLNKYIENIKNQVSPKDDGYIDHKTLCSYFETADKCNEWIDKQLGYKEYTLKESPMPKTGELEDTIKAKDEWGQISFVNCTNTNINLYVEIKDIETSEILTLLVRNDDYLTLPIPIGTYSLSYIFGDKWYGGKDKFLGISGKGKSSQNIIIKPHTNLYFTGSLFTIASLNIVDAKEWSRVVEIVNQHKLDEEKRTKEEKIKKLDPNYGLEMQDTTFENISY